MIYFKSQISLFVIIGLILIIITILFTIDFDISVAKSLNLKDKMFLENQIKDCSIESAKKSIYSLALGGGISKKGDEGLYNPLGLKIPFYWKNNVSFFPEIDIMQNDLAELFNTLNHNCLTDLSFKIINSNILYESLITNNSVIFYTDTYYIIKDEDKEYQINLMNIQIDICYAEIIKIVQQFIDFQKRTPNSIPLSRLHLLSETYNFSYQFIEYEDSIILYSIQKDTDFEPIIFNFLAQYQWNNYFKKEVSIDSFSPIYLFEDEIIRLSGKATGKNISYYDNSNLFDIHPITGYIELYTEGLKSGKNTFIIGARDIYGNKDETVLTIYKNISFNLPEVTIVDSIEGEVGKEIYYQVIANDPSNSFLTFIDDTELFDIDVITGIINFVPQKKGNTTVQIIICNEKGQIIKPIKFIIK